LIILLLQVAVVALEIIVEVKVQQVEVEQVGCVQL
jgi:hypothetical protein